MKCVIEGEEARMYPLKELLRGAVGYTFAGLILSKRYTQQLMLEGLIRR